MVTLLDVNVLVALFDPDHIHHETAHNWFADHHRAGWATCPLTENAFVRVLSQAQPGAAAVRPAALVERLSKFCASGHHTFWPDAVSLRDRKLFRAEHIAGHRQITDIYLLGLARKMRGRLGTFDRSIPLGAVVSATDETLAVIATGDSPSSGLS
jgi:toxin-antitoxin system PIN domain toxin